MLYRLLIYIPLIVFLTALQSAIIRLFPNAVYQPDLTTIAIVYLAYREGRMVGQIMGFFSGILEDAIGLAPFGFHILVRTIMGYVMGYTTEWRVSGSSLVSLVLVFFGILMQLALYLLNGTLFGYSAIVISTLSMQSVWEGLLTILFTPICFSLFALLPTKKKLYPETKSGSKIS